MPGLPSQKSSFWGCSDATRKKGKKTKNKKTAGNQVMLQNILSASIWLGLLLVMLLCSWVSPANHSSRSFRPGKKERQLVRWRERTKRQQASAFEPREQWEASRHNASKYPRKNSLCGNARLDYRGQASARIPNTKNETSRQSGCI